MDNFEYLNRISQLNRPQPAKPQKGLSTGIVVKIVAGGIVLFFLLMAFGSLIGNLNQKSTELTRQVYLRTTNLNSVTSNYNRYLKSSRLRGINTALSAVLTNTSSQLAAYMTTNFSGKNPTAPTQSTIDSETALISELNYTLENARLNGILDRYYDAQIDLQISLLMAQVSELLARTKDTELIQILTPFYSSLETFHNNFAAYLSN